MTVGELFAGIGGLGIGLERAGMTVKWQVEKDDFCRRVLAKHWPDVTRYEDVCDVGAHNLEPVDLICGGFPCQPVSLAGKGLAQADERWLWPEYARIIRELRPRFALMENVPGLLVRGFGDVLGDLAEIGYNAEWEVLPAAAFGARHIRNRAFVLAYPRCDGLETRDGQAQEGRGQSVFRNAPPPKGAIRWDLTESPILRGDHGIPDRVDRLRALGNAVVPQVAQWIGERIMEAA